MHRLDQPAKSGGPGAPGGYRGDEHRALLPRLLDLLTPEERTLLSYRPIQQRMGLTKAEQWAMEEAALEKLRDAARGPRSGLQG